MSPSIVERGMGMILPSSNRVVERTTEAVLAHFPGVAASYARIPYWGDGITKGNINQEGYDTAAFVTAGELLSHARVEVVCWNGTRGAGMGFDADVALGQAVTAACGVPFVSTALATLDLLRLLKATTIAIVTPSSAPYMSKLAAGFASRGHPMVVGRAVDKRDNFDSAAVHPAELADLCREACKVAMPDAVLIYTTNGRGLPIMAELERELSIPVLDSAAIGVWACLMAMEIDPKPAAFLGSMFTVKGKLA